MKIDHTINDYIANNLNKQQKQKDDFQISFKNQNEDNNKRRVKKQVKIGMIYLEIFNQQQYWNYIRRVEDQKLFIQIFNRKIEKIYDGIISETANLTNTQ